VYVSFGLFLFLATLGFSLAAPLGPVNMQMIKHVLKSKNGWILGVFTGLGAMTGDFIISMTVLFIGAEFLVFLLDIKIISVLLFLANSLILGYLGMKALRSEVSTDFLEETNDKQTEELQKLNQNPVKEFGIGFVIVTTSPWSYLWWATFGPVILGSNIQLSTLLDRFIVTMMFLTGILLWIIVLNGSLIISHSFASKSTLHRITQGSALLILIFAIIIFLDAIWIIFTDNPLRLLNKFFDLFSP
jgi:threonine/homoserine/homoserine lactone efflux protein